MRTPHYNLLRAIVSDLETTAGAAGIRPTIEATTLTAVERDLCVVFRFLAVDLRDFAMLFYSSSLKDSRILYCPSNDEHIELLKGVFHRTGTQRVVAALDASVTIVARGAPVVDSPAQELDSIALDLVGAREAIARDAIQYARRHIEGIRPDLVGYLDEG